MGFKKVPDLGCNRGYHLGHGPESPVCLIGWGPPILTDSQEFSARCDQLTGQN